MNTKKLASLIKNHGTIYFDGYGYLSMLKRFADDPDLSAIWLNTYKDMDWIDPPNVLTTTTYQDCVSCEICLNDDNDPVFYVTVYDGDNLDGCRISKRCLFSLVLREIPDELVNQIDEHLRHAAVWEYERQQEEAYNAAIANIKASILEQL